MPRRLLPLAAVALVVALSAGCADKGALAASAGDSIEITNDELMAEVAEWAQSPALLSQVGIQDPEGASPGSYATSLVDVVLTNRLRFELHREQFEKLGLVANDADAPKAREQLAPALKELSPAFGDRLVDDFVVANAVSTEMGSGYAAWAAEATSGGIAVNPRYGSWDRQAAAVLPPDGPRPAPASILTGG